MTTIPKGTIIHGPDGQGYEITEPVDDYAGYISSRQVKPIGGAPTPHPGMVMQQWVLDGLRKEAEAQRPEAGESNG